MMQQPYRILAKATLLLTMLWAVAACALPPGSSTVPAAQPTTANAESAGMVAFVRGQTLWMQTGNDESTAITVEACAENNCRINFPKWSPDGTYLLYYWWPVDQMNAAEIRLADRSGAVQTVAQNAAFIRPADWSPDGSAIVYLVNTERLNTATDAGHERMLEVWTVDLTVDGTLQNAQPRGEVGFGEGCGGGGRSTSAELYEQEGGFAYGYLAGIVEWTPAEILLFSNNCGSRGVGRFDLTSGALLEPYAGSLRSLTLTADGSRWAAVTHENQLVLGSPESLDYTVVPTEQAVEMAFFGPVSDRLYFTTLTTTGEYVDLSAEAAALGEGITVTPYFQSVQPALYGLSADLTTATLLYAAQDYAYARVTEGADGILFFARVETDDALKAALTDGTLTAANQAEFLPQVDIMQMALITNADGTLPSTPPATVWLEQAQAFAYPAGSAPNQ